MAEAPAVLEITDLCISFAGHRAARRAVNGVSLSVGPGEIVAVIGESGSGKTITALATLGLLPRSARVDSGSIKLKGKSLLQLSAAERRKILGNRIAYIPQDARRALNPTLTIADQVAEPFVLHRDSHWSAARRR